MILNATALAKQVEDLDNRFTYNAPHGDQPERYEQIREHARDLAILLVGLCPESRELSLALTNLEQSVIWANKAIACNEPPPEVAEVKP